MSTPFYNTDTRRSLLLEEARSWLGTPFRENCAIKGRDGGVDCAHYQAACHAAAGACQPLDLPVLPVEQVRAWHQHNASSLIMNWLAQDGVRGRVRRIEPEETPMIGDLVLLKLDLTEHHLGLWCGPELFHVAIPAGVVTHSTRDPDLRNYVRCYYRILA